MNILAALKQEEAKLQRQLAGIQGAIKALNGRASGIQVTNKLLRSEKRVMSAAARAKISKATKARWAKFRAEKDKKALGDLAVRKTKQVKRRVLSAAGRAKISKAAKARWAKIRAQAKSR